MRRGLVGWLAAQLLASAALAQAPPAALTPEVLERDLEVFRLLRRGEFTPPQVQALSDVVLQVGELRTQLAAQDADPAVQEVLRAIRTAAAAGEEPQEEIDERLTVARAEAAKRLGRPLVGRGQLYELVQPAAQSLAAKLSPEQAAALAAPEAAWQARDVIGELANRLAQPPDRWQRWVDELVTNLSRRREADREAFGTAVRELLAKLRKLPPDDFHAQRRTFETALADLMQPTLNDAQRRERAAGQLAELLLNPRLGACLADYQPR
ncbi:MAG: hypothetical protein IT204_00380 [Fimbriimonadaceae bacterium]|nr:hypothetical protein [Fimbriimonadaceae bacterium]